MPDSKYMGIPFGTSGDKATIPEATQPNGAISWQQGFGPDYERDPATDPLAKRVPRDETNEFYYQTSNAIKFLQLYGVGEWYTADDLGNDVSYPVAAIVRHNGAIWASISASNTSEPGTDATKWVSFDPFSFTSLEATLAEALAGTSGAKIITPRRLASAVQAGRWNYVLDTSGTPNLVTIAPSPAVTALTAGMMFQVRIANSNTGATTASVSGLPAVPVVRLDGSALFDSDLIGGGVHNFVYDGSSFRVLSTFAPPQLRRPVTLYVNGAIGNDTNDGSANTASRAMATIQGAVDRAFAFGPGSQTITIQVASGTYGRVLIPEKTGPGLNIIGNPSTPSNCVIDGGAISDCFSVYGPNVVRVSGFRAQMTRNGSARAGFIAYGASTLTVVSCETGGIDGASLQAYGGGSLSVTDHRFTSSSAVMYRSNVGGILAIAGTQTFVGPTPLNIAVAQAADLGLILVSGGNPVSFVNPANVTAGRKYAASTNGVINTLGGGPNFFPGPTPGDVTTGGQYV